MPDKKKKRGKQTIINDVRAKGFSARKARKAVNTVFALMKEALSYGEWVEVPPLGTLQVRIRQGTPKERLQKTRNIATKDLECRVMTFPGWRRGIKLKTDPRLKLPVSPALAAVKPPSVPDKVPANRPPISIQHAYWGGSQPRKVPSRVKRSA